MVRLPMDRPTPSASLMIPEGEYATDRRLVRMGTPFGQLPLTASSSHVITMDLHASQIQGTFVSSAFVLRC